MSLWGTLRQQASALARQRGITATLARAREITATLARHRGTTATVSAVAVVVVAGVIIAAASHGSPHERLSSVSDSKAIKAHAKKTAPANAKPLRLVSVTPGNGSADVNGADPITVTFASALSRSTPLPKLYPEIAGSWRVSGRTATFTPQVGYMPGTTVTVTVPSDTRGSAAPTQTLAKASTVRFSTGSFSTLRLQELLAQLGYLPFTWTAADPATGDVPTADANAQLSAAYDAPAGSFTWNAQYPSQLTSQWHAGSDNILVNGAVRAFEYNQGLTMDGEAGPEVWSHLLTAIAKDQANPNGYTYALATQGSSNESLQVWHNGKKILDTPANTGIAASPTQDGTFPVYERLQYQVMKGTNPDGSQYADPVYWVSYFNGGDAVHYFDRASYGFYQSLGCVELEWDPAKFIWPYMTYGTLVTVQGPVA